jgi:O-acetyl-ADP-ribose deacetylase (regulator of RNase III)
MPDALKALFKQPYWVIALVLGVALIVLPSVKESHLQIQAQSARLLVVVGIVLLAVSVLGFGLTLWTKYKTDEATGTGLDFTRVKESNGMTWTTVSGCEIRVVNGRVQDYEADAGTVIVLPCNEYFDDRCAGDTKSALGAYVNHAFEGRVEEFISLVNNECKKNLKVEVQQKTDGERAESFGVGQCVLLLKPLGRSVPVALVSTTTQRAGEGLAARISYLFDGMRELVRRLADARLNEVAMPLLGAGHGRVDPSLAFVGLLLAVAEAARYGQGGQRLRRVTIIVFKQGTDTPAQVDQVVVRRALALIGSRD